MLEKEFQYYINAQPELVKKYDGKHLVIVGDSVVGAYESRELALDTAHAKYQPGTFLVQLCTPGESAYTQNYYSLRAKFNG